MNREPSLPELDRRYAELRHSAEGQEPIAILLALQKLMLTIVARVGSSRLLEEYVTASPLSTFYLWNEALTPESVKSLLSRTDAMMAKLADNDARAASRTCQTIRLLPVEEVALAA
jgi:DNA-binding GntR family transcriptional regulator